MSKLICSKKEEIKKSDADLDGGDCDVEGEISDNKDKTIHGCMIANMVSSDMHRRSEGF